MTPPAASIGFVGVGNMGWPMAANLVKSGFAVAVADEENEDVRSIAQQGRSVDHDVEILR